MDGLFQKQKQPRTRGCFLCTEGRYKTNISKEIKRNKANKNQQVTKYLFSYYFPFLRLFCHFLRPICAPNKIK